MSSLDAREASARWMDGGVCRRLGEGHIHDTLLLDRAGEHFVLQAVNEFVFKDADLVMRQTRRLINHWRNQSRYRVPALVPSKQGRDAERIQGRLWRVWRFVSDTRVVEPVGHIRQAQAAAAAFGFFQSHMQNMPGEPFQDTITGFLQLAHYLDEFDQVAKAAPRDLVTLVNHHRALAEQFEQRNAFIHGDCKVNNLLFDPAGDQVVALIDFDTAMMGHWAWDFGDLVRSVCHSRGQVEMDFYAACVRGFAGEQSLANPAECVAAPLYVALMLGVRFLTDHLQGDRYFRVDEHGENLQRAHQQFDLCRAFIQHRDTMRRAADTEFEDLL